MRQAETPRALLAADLDAKLPSSGVGLREAILLARAWWDRDGRHVITNKEFKDPDAGIPSGIARGLPFEELTREEQAAVISRHHEDKLLPLTRAPDPIVAAIEEAARRYRAAMKAAEGVVLAVPRSEAAS
jgi:hypothetical protein